MRTPLTPQHCRELQEKFPGVRVLVQSSLHRCYTDEDYRNEGITVTDDLSEADIILGVKEVPIEALLPGKTYLFFSHTIKKQPHNRLMLRDILRKGIRLIDYETLVWDAGNRIIGFGRFAGIVGSHYALLMWGKRTGAYSIKAASQCRNMEAMYEQYQGLTIPKVRIVLCGDGRVAHGATEFFRKLKIHHVTPEEFLEDDYDHPVWVNLRSEDYYERKDLREWDKSDFYKHPEDYRSRFSPYYKRGDIMINAVFWKDGIEPFFTHEEMKRRDFSLKIISDITCDIPGPLPSTVRSTTIEQPFYGYHPLLEKEVAAFSKEAIDVQSVGNLPCELPFEASIEFSEQLIRHVFPNLIYEDKGDIVRNATITENGKLCDRYLYLSDFVS